ncbi:MAG: poly(A)-specific ribonuclease [Trizodia sp. TS-e1964]|nr:MAG: poly(A)-specific ribonuclease [Trizodia sp. TS-e1964]
MFTIDVEKGAIAKEVPTKESYILMRRSSIYICAATNSGSINILDPSSFHIVKSWRAHAAINDIDAKNSYLVTCGFSLRQQQNWVLDPLANVFDLRTLTQLAPIPFHAGAAYVRMHPKMSTTGIVASQTGQLQVVDLMNPNTVNVRQANTSSYLSMLDFAPSGEALVLADIECSIHLWGSPSKVRFTEFGNPTEFADLVAPAPYVDWNLETPLSTIGIPYYHEKLLSAWPTELISELGKPPFRVDSDMLPQAFAGDIGVYGTNPKLIRRNQAMNTRNSNKGGSTLIAPKFLSEKAKDAKGAEGAQQKVGEATSALGNIALAGGTESEVPVFYHKVDIKYSKFGVEDFDFGQADFLLLSR